MTNVMIAPPKPVQSQAADAPASPNGSRSLLVTIGPSLVLDSLMAFCSYKAVTGVLTHHGLRAQAALGALAPWLYLVAIRGWVLNWARRGLRSAENFQATTLFRTARGKAPGR